MQLSPNMVNNFDSDERIEGVLAEQGDTLGLELTDQQVASIIGHRVEDAVAWWNEKLNLDEVRKRGEKYYLNESYQESDLYDYQVPYKNNRIITAVETLVPMITSQPAEPIVTEAQDTDESRELAQDLGNVLLAMYEDQYMKQKLSMAARHLMVGKRIAVIKYRFDPTKGKLREDGSRRGEIVTEVVRPEKVVFEQQSTDPDNVGLIAEYLTSTIEELCVRFPDKKDEIYQKFDIKRGVRSQTSRIIGHMEVWFTYYDSQNKRKEAVAWKIDQLILGKAKNPNWNYGEMQQIEQGIRSLNFFSEPHKPYIVVNHLNLGKYIIDDTSFMDQSIPLQDTLNKRGRQIVENADQASSGRVLNEDMISQDDAAKLIGDPSEIIMVKGDVRAAAARLPINQLPNYVTEDKYDARAEIDNLFGANAPIRGENSGIKTLGQEVISQRANLGRLQTIADSIEDAMDRLYKAWIQMMMVYWDEPEIVRFQDSAGKTQFIEWSRDKIEDGIQVRVKAGSVMPKDKQTIKNETMQLAGILDPLTLAEGLDKENPKEVARRILYYRFEYPKYLALLGEEGTEHDSKAMDDIMALIGGQNIEVPASPSKKYLFTLELFLKSRKFNELDEQQKQSIIGFMQQVMMNAKQGIGEQSQMEPQGEMPMEEPTEELPPEELPTEEPQIPEPTPEPESTPMATPPTGNILQRGLQGLMARLRGGK